MITDRAVSPDVLDRGEVVRLAGSSPPLRRDQGYRDPRAPPRSRGSPPPGWPRTALLARSWDLVRVDPAATARTTPTPHRHTSHAAGMASPSDHTEMDLVGAENPVASRHLQVFVDQSAEAIPPEGSVLEAVGCGGEPSGRWVLMERPVRAVGVVVLAVLA